MRSIGFTDKNKNEKYNGLMACYHLHFDKDLGIGKSAVRRIPCNCDACYKVKCAPWQTNVKPSKQFRFQHNPHCHYSSVFGKLNDWIILSIAKKDINDGDDMDELKKDVLLGVQDGISETITIGNFRVYMTWSERFGNEYDIVKWKSEPYTPQCNKKKANNDVQICRMVEITHCNKVKSSRRKYVVSESTESIELKHVLFGDVNCTKIFQKTSKKRFYDFGMHIYI